MLTFEILKNCNLRHSLKPLKIQKSNPKTQNLNSSTRNGFNLNFNQFSENSKTRIQTSMCENNVIYIRITTPKIIPSFLYWHLIQEFKLNNVRKLMGSYDYLAYRYLARQPIFFNGIVTTIGDISCFVPRKSLANISVGRYPENFGEVILINDQLSPHRNGIDKVKK
jgi:hypothetical protein